MWLLDPQATLDLAHQAGVLRVEGQWEAQHLAATRPDRQARGERQPAERGAPQGGTFPESKRY